jgi:predicted acyltransferase
MSLDVFRGLTIILMLLVNNVVLDRYTPWTLTHASWNEGVSAADLVFPWFLFIVGTAIPFSQASQIRRGIPGWKRIPRAAGRAVGLVLLGFLIDSSIAHRPVLGMEVLQLIGLAFLTGTLIYQIPAPWRVICAILLLVMHWTLLKCLPIPGYETGIFTEKMNVIRYINDTYLSPHFRGIISVIPGTAMVLIGTIIGDWLRNESITRLYRAVRIMVAGLAMVGVAMYWNEILPFNKPVWTGSYILFCGGFGTLVLGLLYVIMDVAGLRAWAFPIAVFGMNSIAAYVAPILVKVYIFQGWTWKLSDGSVATLQDAILHYLRAHAGIVGGGWIYTIGYIFVWWLVMLELYRRKVFLRV